MARLVRQQIMPRKGMRHARITQEIPMDALAAATGFSKSWLHKVENGKVGLYLEHATLISAALGVQTDALL